MDWLGALRGLRADAIRVEHVPLTPRYVRAAQKLEYVRRTAILIGVRAGETPDTVEIATWSPPGHGRGNGFYGCFRLLLDAELVVEAVLWCFYDGKDHSMGFRSANTAAAFARYNQYEDADEPGQG